MKLSSLFLALGFALSAMAAHADTIDVFDLTNASTDKSDTLSGTINIDVTTGVVESVDFGLYTGTTLLNTYTGIVNTSRGTPAQPFSDTQIGIAMDSLDLDLPGINLVGYTGGFCSRSSPCGSGFFSSIAAVLPIGGQDIESGSLTLDASATQALSPTPEPSSLALLGTGLLGVAGVARRRALRA